CRLRLLRDRVECPYCRPLTVSTSPSPQFPPFISLLPLFLLSSLSPPSLFTLLPLFLLSSLSPPSLFTLLSIFSLSLVHFLFFCCLLSSMLLFSSLSLSLSVSL